MAKIKNTIMKNLIFTLLLAISTSLFAQQKGFVNPIIPGGHPDPSICRVGDDFYIVNSTFEYFPGLPIHHSKDLVNWELIGYGLHREDQVTGAVNLVDVQQNGGIHAPTIRYNNGTFYIIVTNVYSPKEIGKPGVMVNFIITANDPAGPWSSPHVIEGAPGIDPDLFFDDDGKVYFVGTHAVGQPNENGIGEIWVQELDLVNWKLVGERNSVWRGACGGCCVEGPHMYKVNDTYYLMVAEGGTSYNHAVMIAASDKITGPFDSNPRNPILTSRHLSKNNWVHSTGHADLVELEDGRWYMVSLGKRNDKDGSSNMGRETYLMPVIWESSIARWEQVSETKWEPIEFMWPVTAPETGKVERYTKLPFPDSPQRYNDAFTDDFGADRLNLEWNFRRVPQKGTYSLEARKGFLRLYLKPETFKLREQYSLMGIRQKESDFEYSAKLQFEPKKENAEAGISIFQQDDNYVNFTVEKKDGNTSLKLLLKGRGQNLQILKQDAIPNYTGDIVFKLVSKNDNYKYLYSLDDGENFILFSETAGDLVLCYGYIGTNLGIYATSNGNATKEYADFDWVSYKGYPRF
jgi:alpha-N-arabinofuranosidase